MFGRYKMKCVSQAASLYIWSLPVSLPLRGFNTIAFIIQSTASCSQFQLDPNVAQTTTPSTVLIDVDLLFFMFFCKHV